MSFLDEFQIIAEKYTHKNAVIYLRNAAGEENFEYLTYKDLKENFENFAEVISQNVTETNCCFALLMTHNPYIPSIVMSLQKLGHCFVFMDESFSQELQLELIKQLNIKWLISFGRQEAAVGVATATLAPELILWKSQLKLNESSISFNDILYVICTSGTTGANKVVRVKNNCIYSNVKSIMDTTKISSQDIIYFGTALTFDPSIVELYLALVSGATLLMLPRKVHANPERLFKNLFLTQQNHRTSFLQMCPSVFLRFSEPEIDYIFRKSCLKILCLGGEEFPVSLLGFEKRDDLKVYNLYGITEVSCWASIFEVKNATKNVCLGNPLAETSLEVRDENGCCVEGGIGEMFIGSKSRICLVNTEIVTTDETIFRASGDLIEIRNKKLKYICRKNDLIKRYGVRVVLTNVESKIFQETRLLNKCIWFERQSKLLLFFLIPNFKTDQKDKIIDKLRVKLLHVLSKEYYPDYFDILKTCPITQNGKLDKTALCELFLSASATLKTLNAVGIFNELLMRYFGSSYEKMSVTFLEAGANSILLLQFFEEIKTRYHGEIPHEFLAMLFERNIADCRQFLMSLKTKERKRPRESNEYPDKQSNLHNCDSFLFEVVWKYDMKACVDSSPTIIEQSSGNDPLVAVGGFAHIFAVINAVTGLKMAETILPETIEAACSPSRCKNFLFVGCFDSAMYCIRIGNGEIVWKFVSGDRIKCTPALCQNGEAMVFGSYDGHVYCLNTADGALVWKNNLQAIVNTNPLIVEEKVFIATITGNFYCLLEKTGDVVWCYSTKQSVFGSPCSTTIDGKKCVCWPNVNGNINCLSCNDGQLLWTYKASNQIFSSLLHFHGFIIFGCHDKFLYCVKADATASLKFRTNLDAPISSTPCIFQKTFIAASTISGSVYIISLENGEIHASINLGAQIFSSPSVCDNTIYLGCRDNYLYCLKTIKKVQD